MVRHRHRDDLRGEARRWLFKRCCMAAPSCCGGCSQRGGAWLRLLNGARFHRCPSCAESQAAENARHVGALSSRSTARGSPRTAATSTPRIGRTPALASAAVSSNRTSSAAGLAATLSAGGDLNPAGHGLCKSGADPSSRHGGRGPGHQLGPAASLGGGGPVQNSRHSRSLPRRRSRRLATGMRLCHASAAAGPRDPIADRESAVTTGTRCYEGQHVVIHGRSALAR